MTNILNYPGNYQKQSNHFRHYHRSQNTLKLKTMKSNEKKSPNTNQHRSQVIKPHRQENRKGEN